MTRFLRRRNDSQPISLGVSKVDVGFVDFISPDFSIVLGLRSQPAGKCSSANVGSSRLDSTAFWLLCLRLWADGGVFCTLPAQTRINDFNNIWHNPSGALSVVVVVVVEE